ncbi:uncharacterized protein BDZ99DRAFT_473606 [Mytilinidion resinicola]|uniref:Uncharacterized protein n=1 Tax=Mytilinidion resinicola TaxID=574789 RepID=A0A6A6YV77_9PEZI|nr:uncharacterized protein BDZ99DRAFT_473606 [Mytilinidion resinicola]KAF2812842.1 hypothetical protein BDZ99DRAFT_473606 [Mytilinidion resinicola]
MSSSPTHLAGLALIAAHQARAARTARQIEDESHQMGRGFPWAARDAAGFWYVAVSDRDSHADSAVGQQQQRAASAGYCAESDDGGYETDSSVYSTDDGEDEVGWVQVGADEFVRTVAPKRARAAAGGRGRKRGWVDDEEEEEGPARKKAKTRHDSSEVIALIEPYPVYEMRVIPAWEWARWNQVWDQVLACVRAAEAEEAYEERVRYEQRAGTAWDPDVDRVHVDAWIYKLLRDAQADANTIPLAPGFPAENHVSGFGRCGIDLAHPLKWVEVTGGTKARRNSKLLQRRLAKHHYQASDAEALWAESRDEFLDTQGAFGPQDCATLPDALLYRLAFPYELPDRQPQRNADGSAGATLAYPLHSLNLSGHGGTAQQRTSQLFARRWTRYLAENIEWSEETLRLYLAHAEQPITDVEVAGLEENYGPCQFWAENYGVDWDVLDLHVPWWTEELAPGETGEEGDETDDEGPVEEVEGDALAELFGEFVDTFYDICEQGLDFIERSVSPESDMSEDELDFESDARYCAGVILGDMFAAEVDSETSADQDGGVFLDWYEDESNETDLD